jgi:hypothetical protein
MPDHPFYFLITNNGENSVTIVFQIEGGEKQTLNLAPGSSKFYVAPEKFSHPPSSGFNSPTACNDDTTFPARELPMLIR